MQLLHHRENVAGIFAQDAVAKHFKNSINCVVYATTVLYCIVGTTVYVWFSFLRNYKKKLILPDFM